MIGFTALSTCCSACLDGGCSDHGLPSAIQLAGRQAGCLEDDGGARPKEQHRLVVDGSFPGLLHLHHENRPEILVFTASRGGPTDWLDGVLTWLEALHYEWLDD